MNATNTLSRSALVVALLAATTVAQAGPRFDDDSRHETRVRARVVSSEPVYETIREPQTQCWTETVGHNPYRSQREGSGGAVLGAIAGGFIVAYSEVFLTFAYKQFLAYILPAALVPDGLVQFLSTEYKFAISFAIPITSSCNPKFILQNIIHPTLPSKIIFVRQLNSTNSNIITRCVIFIFINLFLIHLSDIAQNVRTNWIRISSNIPQLYIKPGKLVQTLLKTSVHLW